MRPTSSTSLVRSKDCETVTAEAPRQTSSSAVTRRPRSVFDISSEQIAKMTELLQEDLRLTEQIANHWARVVELWDETVRCHAAMIGKGDGRLIVPDNHDETRCLTKSPCAGTQVIEKHLKGNSFLKTIPLPYGVADLDPQVVVHPDNRDVVRCYVRGCGHFVGRPTKHRRGELCPDHGIFCHHSSYGSTYSYADVRRNIIASPDVFAERIIGHPFKYESQRLGSEKSEDALSWNVFRSLQEAGCLAQVANLLIGQSHPEEPDLYLWGIRVSDDSFEPWDLLIAARERFESDLPVDRPLTEPDIALHLPGRYLALIEAKFTSPNTFYERGERKDEQSLTMDELLAIYQDPDLRMLNTKMAKSRDRVAYQLWRNTILAEWMAMQDSARTKAFHINLVREGHEEESAAGFGELLRGEHAERFRRATWEEVHRWSRQQSPTLDRLCEYIDQKTAQLRKAFRV